MSDLLRHPLESMLATVDQFLSEVEGFAGSHGELEERISDFATVIAIDAKAAREALAVEPEYEYRVMAKWPDFKGQYYSATSIEAAEGCMPQLRREFPDADVYAKQVEVVTRSCFDALKTERDRYRQGLIDCATQAGADVSDGPPDWPALEVWAVRAVREMRETFEAEEPTRDTYGQCPSCDTIVRGPVNCPTCGLEP